MIETIAFKPSKAKHKNHDQMYEEMLKLREENWRLKNQFEKLNNFWDYAKMDKEKIRTQEEKLQAEKQLLVDQMYKINTENEKLKSQFEHKVDPKMEKFAKDLENEEWSANTNLYGNYINQMILDNKAKSATIEKLKEQLYGVKLQLNETEMRDFKLPDPGQEFSSQDGSKKQQSYSLALYKLNIYKKEFETMCDSMKTLTKEHEEEFDRFKQEKHIEYMAIKQYCDKMKDKTEYYTLYEAAKKRIEEYEKEMELMGKYGDKEAREYDISSEELKQRCVNQNDQVKQQEDERHETLREIRDKNIKINELEFKNKRQIMCKNCSAGKSPKVKDRESSLFKNSENRSNVGDSIDSKDRSTGSRGRQQSKAGSILESGQIGLNQPSINQDTSISKETRYSGSGGSSGVNGRKLLRGKTKEYKPQKNDWVYLNNRWKEYEQRNEYTKFYTEIDQCMKSKDLKMQASTFQYLAEEMNKNLLQPHECIKRDWQERVLIYQTKLGRIPTETTPVIYAVQFLSGLIAASGNFQFYNIKLHKDEFNWYLFFHHQVNTLCNSNHTFARYSASEILMNFIGKKFKHEEIFGNKEWIFMFINTVKTSDMNIKINLGKILSSYIEQALTNQLQWGSDRIYKELVVTLVDGVCNFRNMEFQSVNLGSLLKLITIENLREIILIENFANRLINLLRNQVSPEVNAIVIHCIMSYMTYTTSPVGKMEILILDHQKNFQANCLKTDQLMVIDIIGALGSKTQTLVKEKLEQQNKVNEGCFDYDFILDDTISKIYQLNLKYAKQFTKEYEKYIDSNFYRLSQENLLKESHILHKDTIMEYVVSCAKYTKPILITEGLVYMIMEKNRYLGGVDGVLKAFVNFSKQYENMKPMVNKGVFYYLESNLDVYNSGRLSLICDILKNFIGFVNKKGQASHEAIRNGMGKESNSRIIFTLGKIFEDEIKTEVISFEFLKHKRK